MENNKYIIRELANPQSYCEGYTVQCKSLTEAKRLASRNQMFQGTCLRIESDRGVTLSEKISGNWRDSDDLVW